MSSITFPETLCQLFYASSIESDHTKSLVKIDWKATKAKKKKTYSISWINDIIVLIYNTHVFSLISLLI